MSGTLAQNLWAAAELLVGFVLVMLTLSVLWGMTALMSRVIAWLQTQPSATAANAAAVAAAAAKPAPAVVASPGPDDQEIAVVAAAVAVLLDRPHRIVHVLPLASAWGRQGRLDTQASRRKAPAPSMRHETGRQPATSPTNLPTPPSP